MNSRPRTLPLALLALVGIMSAAAGLAAPAPPGIVEAAASAAQPSPSPSPSPAARASPSPTPVPGALDAVGTVLTSPWTLIGIGLVLTIVTLIAWFLSNRAEATPNAEQLEEIRRFVEGDFARYVARSLLGTAGDAAALTVPNVAADEGWRKVFVHHLDLHHELYRFRKAIALDVYTRHINEAVGRELTALRASGSTPAPANGGTGEPTRPS